jgi:hypothetical protein
MDTALPVEDRVAVWQVLKGHEQAGVKFHALWTRQAHVEFKVAGRIHMQKNAPQVSL